MIASAIAVVFSGLLDKLLKKIIQKLRRLFKKITRKALVMDSHTTIDELKAIIKQFTQERDWDKFLSPKTISTYLSIEATELLEKFVFVDNQESKQRLVDKRFEVEQELADVLYWVLQMS